MTVLIGSLQAAVSSLLAFFIAVWNIKGNLEN